MIRDRALDRYADEVAGRMGLQLDAEMREGVVWYLAGLLEAGRLLTEFPLADDTEPAPVFQP
ncbi:MAG TPA: DUF4089 domain-containing protein [Candidatus Tectomicrobia bacterium]|nr:DUF4089 domain-containing protein [Candidatus Tectomicrobia bacterium]